MPVNRRPLAELKWSSIQRACFIGCIGGSAVLAAIDLSLFLWVFSLFLLLLYSLIVLFKVLAVLLGLIDRFTLRIQEDDYRSLDEDALPVYTILLPLYKESQVVEKLIAHIGCLDYPKDKLDVKVLLELNDSETLQAIKDFGLPEWCELIFIPDEGPQTKPRACNAGLAQARGTYTVIFDAEDQPEPDQLKKAVCAYRTLPDQVVCLQAKLNFFNAREALLTRCFALEYTTWFDLYLPGLHAIASPIPLGGTSNHFKTDALRELHGWDPYNVTEDCDLGVRIAEAGYATRIIDSVTWEEAPFQIKDWLGQRSRWIKGYFQSFWVHTRQPCTTIHQLGLWGFLQMLISVGGQVATVFFNPICWLVLLAWLVWRWPIVHAHSPYTLLLFAVSLALFQFNVLFIGIHLLAALRRRSYYLIPAVFALPWYWILVSIGAWRGVFEFFWAPYKWVKTSHGLTHLATPELALKQLDNENSGSRQNVFIPPLRRNSLVQRLSMATTIIVLSVLITGSSILAPAYFGYVAKVEQARINLTDNFIESENELSFSNASWIGHDRVTVELKLSPPAEPASTAHQFSEKDLRLMFFIKVRDGEWFHQQLDDFSVEDNYIRCQVSLTGGWSSLYADFDWSGDLLRRVRAFGVKTFYGDIAADVQITSLEPQLSKTPAEQVQPQIVSLSGPDQVQRYAVFEAEWLLTKQYSNPFDPDIVACDVVFTHVDGSSVRIPAFYTQDYLQYKDAAGEQLQPKGQPHWAVRFSPPKAGVWTWQIHGRDHNGDAFSSDPSTLKVSDREHRGFVTLGKNKRYFSFQNGDFFYPIIFNIRSPRDERNHEYFDFSLPNKEDGTYAMFGFLTKMKDAGINVGRVWMSPWYGGIEWNAGEDGYHGTGIYNLKNAHRLDSIFEKALHYDIFIELALNHHGPFTQQYDSQWKDNPYFIANGGPARSPRDILTTTACKDLFKKRLRYISARYGAYPNLFCYVLWIEANVVDPRPDVLRDWHREFGPYMKEIDSHRHLVSTEFNNNGYPDIWSQQEIDYTQIAAYNHGRGSIHEMAAIAKTLRPYDKPAIIEEYMGMPAGGHMDMLAHEFHDGPWATWMLPIGGAPMPWWWNFIFAKNLEQQYIVFNAFINNEDLSQREWKHLFEMQYVNGTGLRALGRLSSDQAFFWVYKDSVSNIRFGGPYRQRRATAYKAYRAQVPPDFSPIDALCGRQEPAFMTAADVRLIIPQAGLKPGRYRVEYWNTWKAYDFSSVDIEITSFPYELPLPDLTADLAIKLKALDP